MPLFGVRAGTVTAMETEGIGHRVATARKIRGWNQSELATRSGYSLSMIKKIERGARPVDRYSTLHTFARVLAVDVAELTGEPLRLHRGHAEKAHQAVPPIRQALMAWPYGDLADGPVRPAAELQAAVAKTIRGRQAGRFSRFGEDVPPLLEELRRGAESGPHAEQINAALAELLHGTSMLLRRLSEVDLAWIAAQQARPAALASDDPLLVVANDWHLVELHYRTGDGARATRLADEALRRLDPWLTDPSPQALSLAGTLHLTRSIGAAQVLDRTAADAALAEATAAVARVDPDRDDYQTQFGQPNVAAMTLASAVELGDASRAVELIQAFDATSIPTKERRTRYLIDVARGYAQSDRDDVALRVLIEADKLAPEYVRHHVMARELVAQMVERARALPDGLRSLARRMSLA